jgi:hypothetical protein
VYVLGATADCERQLWRSFFEIKKGQPTDGFYAIASNQLQPAKVAPRIIAVQMSTISTNIFKQTGNLFANWTAGARANFEEQARRRNDGHHYDEALLIVQFLLYAVAVVPIGLGVYYHWNIAANLGGSALAATLLVGLLTIVAEITKIVFGRYLLRAVFNGVWMRSFADFGLTLCMVVMVVGGFVWSINISTKAVAQISAMKANEQRMATDAFTPPPSIAGLDAKIAAAEKMSAKAQRSTWSGKPTKEGLDNMAKAETTKQMLLKQRESDIAAARKDYEERQALSISKITTSSQQVGFWGGAAEVLTIFLLIFLELLMVKCYERNAVAPTPVEAVATTPTEPTPAPQQDLKKTIEEAMRNVLTSKQPIVVAGFQQQPTGSAPTPPPPVAENRGGAVATTSTAPPQPVGAQVSHTFIPEVVEDIEGKVVELCDKFKKEWPSRWRKRVEMKGDLSTMQQNFTQYYNLLNTYLSDEHKPLGAKALAKVEEFRSAYVNEILPTIKTTQP